MWIGSVFFVVVNSLIVVAAQNRFVLAINLLSVALNAFALGRLVGR